MRKKQIALNPRARLVAALGADLISSDTVAVIELVKNAYDADAEHVSVVFHGPLMERTGRIEILDDGHGMSLDTVVGSWMQPATGHKRVGNRSESRRRLLLGEKGIGRFATQRLGHRLKMTTRRQGEDLETELEANWDLFDDESKLLSEVTLSVLERPASTITRDGALGEFWRVFGSHRRKESGTLLAIDGLRHPWKRMHIEQVRRGLSRLIAPHLAEKSNFKIWLQLPPPFDKLSGPIETPAILDRPLYVLRGEVSASGEVALSLSSRAAKRERSLKSVWVWTKPRNAEQADLIDGILDDSHEALRCGSLSFEFRIWDREDGDLRPIAQDLEASVSDLRRDLDEAAGVSVYRDGFRVLPFGEPGNDWLGLDSRRVQNPTLRLSNNQVVGYVAVSRSRNPEIRDQTNRQGLIENDAYADLRAALVKALAWAEEQRYDIRTPIRESRRHAPSLFDRKDLDELAAYVASKHAGDGALRQLVGRVDARSKTIDRQTQEAIARYRRLANLGTLIDKTLHDVRTPLSLIRGEAHFGRADAQAHVATLNGFADRMLAHFIKISDGCEVLSTVTRKLAPLGGRKPGRPREVVFEDILKGAFEFFAAEIKELGIAVYLPATSHIVTVEPGEISQVFYNLVDNAIFWLRRVQRDMRAIRVEVQRRGGALIVDVSDSGPGVSHEIKDRIFEPYFSTKPEGTGLGLAIAGEIIEDYYGGTLELLDRGALPGATFRLTFRKRV